MPRWASRGLALKPRETLLSDVASIAYRGVIDPRKLDPIRGLTGFCPAHYVAPGPAHRRARACSPPGCGREKAGGGNTLPIPAQRLSGESARAPW